MDASETSKIYVSIREDVISKTRSELVSNGKLKLSLLNEIHATWKRKMIQAGIISGTIETTSGSKPVTVHDPLPTPVYAQSGTEIDAKVPPSMELEVFIIKNEHEGLFIPQKDGSGDGDDADIKPTTNAPFDEDDEDLNENDDDDVEEGGGIDDDDFPDLIVCQFDHVNNKKKTKKTTKKWDCKFKAGVMHINGKDILFSVAKGDFEF